MGIASMNEKRNPQKGLLPFEQESLIGPGEYSPSDFSFYNHEFLADSALGTRTSKTVPVFRTSLIGFDFHRQLHGPVETTVTALG